MPEPQILHTREKLVTETPLPFVKAVQEELVLDGKERELKFPPPRGNVFTRATLRADGKAVVSLARTPIPTDLERSDRMLVDPDHMLYEVRFLRGEIR